MKVKERTDSTEARVARDLAQQQESIKAGNTRSAELLAKRLKSETDGTLVGQTSDSVDVSLAKAIATELSPEGMAEERRKRVEQLKQLVAEGKYNPSSEAVARSVGEEILYEIFGAGPLSPLE